jgi:hypothetical protein
MVGHFKMGLFILLILFISGCGVPWLDEVKKDSLSETFGRVLDPERALETRNAESVVGSAFQWEKIAVPLPVQASAVQKCVEGFPLYGNENLGSIMVDFVTESSKTTKINTLLTMLGSKKRLPADKSFSKFGWFRNPKWDSVTWEQFRRGTPVHREATALAWKILDENSSVGEVSPIGREKYATALQIVLKDFISPKTFTEMLKKYNLEPIEIEPIGELNHRFIFEVPPNLGTSWVCYFNIYQKDIITGAYLDQYVDAMDTF